MMRVMTGTKLRERIRTLSISIFFVGVVAVILSAAGVTLRVWNWVVILAAMFVVVFLIRRRQRTGGLPSAVAKAFRTRPPTIRDRLFFLVSAPAVIAAAVLFDWPLWGWVVFASLIGLLSAGMDLLPRRFGKRSRSKPT